MFDESTDISPEERLWKAVVLQLLHDIQSDVYRYRGSLNGKRGLYWQQVQTNLKLAKDKHMEYICALADVDHVRLVRILNEIVYGDREIHVPRFETNFKRHKTMRVSERKKQSL